jgi:putative nucleotidyltransferase with HDIG domain
MPLDREAAFQLVLEKIGEGNLLSHILAVEAGMRAVATRLGEDIESYGLVGLLHDLDYNETKDDHARHTYLTREWLTPYQLPESWLYAIEAHPGHVQCKSTMDWSLYAVDPTTGFLVAASRMHPSKTLAGLDPEFLLRRFNEKRFAAGANREAMASCSQLGFELSDFLLLVRDGMLTIPIRKIAE